MLDKDYDVVNLCSVEVLKQVLEEMIKKKQNKKPYRSEGLVANDYGASYRA